MTVDQVPSKNSVMFIANRESDNAANFAAARWRMKGDATEVVVEKPWTDSIYRPALRRLEEKVSERIERGENVTLIGTGAEEYLALQVAAVLPVTVVTICTEFNYRRLGDDYSAKYGLRKFKTLLDSGKLQVTPDRVVNIAQPGRERTQTLDGASVLRVEESRYRHKLPSISRALMEQGIEYTLPTMIEAAQRKQMTEERRQRAAARADMLTTYPDFIRQQTHAAKVMVPRANVRV